MTPTIQFIGITPDEFMANVINQLKYSLPTQTNEQKDELLTTKQTMQFLSTSRPIIDGYVRNGILKKYFIDKTGYFKKHEILDSLVLEKVKK